MSIIGHEDGEVVKARRVMISDCLLTDNKKNPMLAATHPPLPGDLIFHESLSDPAKAIKEITGSRYTHCGVIVKRDGELYVAEAIEPVRVIATSDHPLATIRDWIARGVDDHAVIKRLSGGLTPEQLELLETAMLSFQALPYDGCFQWNDKAMYCSEFIYDSFGAALEISLGKVQTFREFPLDGPLALALLKDRYTNENIHFDLDEQIITPVALMNDPQLETIATIDHGQVLSD